MSKFESLLGRQFRDHGRRHGIHISAPLPRPHACVRIVFMTGDMQPQEGSGATSRLKNLFIEDRLKSFLPNWLYFPFEIRQQSRRSGTRALTLRLDRKPGGRSDRPAQGMPRDNSVESMTSSAQRKPQ
jgi:hypothetical protein